MDIDDRQMKALRLIDSGWKMQLTPYGNAFVSQQVKALLSAGLIRYEPRRPLGYVVTAAGRKAAQ